MRKSMRYISRQLARFYHDEFLFKARTPVFLPFYHVVSDMQLPHVLNYPFRNTHQFIRELDYLLTHFNPVSIEDLLSEENTGKPVFHLSFDDGLKECAEIIAPLLVKKGIPATFFINSGFVDNKILFHRYKASLIMSSLSQKENPEAMQFLNHHEIYIRNILHTKIDKTKVLDKTAEMLGINFEEFLNTKRPYLSTSQVLDLKNKGFSIGAHSENHPEFQFLSPEQQYGEVTRSIDWLVKNIDPPIKAFSFPFTDSGVSMNLLEKLDSEKICDVTFGTAGLKYDEYPGHFQRYPMEQQGNFKLNLKEEWVYFKIRNRLGKSTVKH